MDKSNAFYRLWDNAEQKREAYYKTWDNAEKEHYMALYLDAKARAKALAPTLAHFKRLGRDNQIKATQVRMAANVYWKRADNEHHATHDHMTKTRGDSAAAAAHARLQRGRSKKGKKGKKSGKSRKSRNARRTHRK